MANVYYEKDADRSLIAGRKVAVMGYGSQGHAHALNLKDSGIDVRVGLREGSSSKAKAEAAGLRVVSTAEAAREADVIMMLLPDTEIGPVYERRGGAEPRPTVTPCSSPTGSTCASATSQAPAGVDVCMVAPEGPGPSRAPHLHRGRRRAVPRRGGDRTQQARRMQLALSYADAIGGTRAGVLETTFEEETETDLFGEQVVLCGGLTALVQAGFETLVEAGYQPESAYFECLHELKLIIDLMYEEGISGMRYSISTTAEYGDLTRGPRIITDETRGPRCARSSTRSRAASSPKSSSARCAAAGVGSPSCGPGRGAPGRDRSARSLRGDDAVDLRRQAVGDRGVGRRLTPPPQCPRSGGNPYLFGRVSRL